MKDTIGLIHPSSIWHEDSAELRGQEIVVKTITECRFIGDKKVKNPWYSAIIRLVNPPESWEEVANDLAINGFRPRRVK